MIALIDGDIVAYRCAASAEHEPVDVALERTDALIERICSDVGATGYTIYLSGSDNFREQINPAYKANRKDKVRPKWLQEVREHMVIGWNASVTDGIEADDALGIEQTRLRTLAGLL